MKCEAMLAIYNIIQLYWLSPKRMARIWRLPYIARLSIKLLMHDKPIKSYFSYLVAMRSDCALGPVSLGGVYNYLLLILISFYCVKMGTYISIMERSIMSKPKMCLEYFLTIFKCLLYLFASVFDQLSLKLFCPTTRPRIFFLM
jgi:hypothetical protein